MSNNIPCKKQNFCLKKIKEWQFEPINLLLRTYFIFGTILTIKAIMDDNKNDWEKYCSGWVWNYVDCLAIMENIYCISAFYGGFSNENSQKKVLWSNIPGTISCIYMIIATTVSISDTADENKLLISNLSFASAMFGSFAAPFVELICEIHVKKIWPKGVSFQKQNLYQSIEWFIAGWGFIGNSFEIDVLTICGCGIAAFMKLLSITASALSTIFTKKK